MTLLGPYPLFFFFFFFFYTQDNKHNTHLHNAAVLPKYFLHHFVPRRAVMCEELEGLNRLAVGISWNGLTGG